MEKIDEFIESFASTVLYAELNKQYTTFEIFEVNAGGFEIPEVQAAFDKWVKQQATDRKRSEFTKNLNHLLSGDYVLVRKST